jgi:hypothetical protein
MDSDRNRTGRVEYYDPECEGIPPCNFECHAPEFDLDVLGVDEPSPPLATSLTFSPTRRAARRGRLELWEGKEGES